jgi:hypothetical protein
MVLSKHIELCNDLGGARGLHLSIYHRMGATDIYGSRRKVQASHIDAVFKFAGSHQCHTRLEFLRLACDKHWCDSFHVV